MEVVLECPESMATVAAETIFRLEPGAASREHVLEALAELVNILGGNLRGSLAPDGPGLRGTTQVGKGPDRDGGAPASVSFRCRGEGFAVSVAPSRRPSTPR